jgi:hypothetical protein
MSGCQTGQGRGRRQDHRPPSSHGHGLMRVGRAKSIRAGQVLGSPFLALCFPLLSVVSLLNFGKRESRCLG